jgi:hypothetical protein
MFLDHSSVVKNKDFDLVDQKTKKLVKKVKYLKIINYCIGK